MTDWQTTQAHIDQYIKQRMTATQTPGVVLALTDDRQTQAITTYGFADLGTQTPVSPDHLFAIGSIGKSFTAVAILQAHEAGLLDVHTPVTEYLPWFEVQSRYALITLHHLLTHSSGLIMGTELAPDPRGIVYALRECEVGFPPGERYYYSDVGYKLLGMVLKKVYGQSYGDVIQAHILNPLGMQATKPVITHAIRPLMAVGYRHLYDDRPAHVSHPLVPATWVETDSGDGSIASTAEDMAKYVRMLLNKGEPLLSADSFAQMMQHWLGPDDVHYSYGIVVRHENDRTRLLHAGDIPGFEAYIAADVSHGHGVALLTTQPYPTRMFKGILDIVEATYRNQPLPESPPEPNPTQIDNAGDYAGSYHAGDRSLTLVAVGGQLRLEWDDEQITLEARDDDSFYISHPDFDCYLLEFGRNDNQQVVELFHGPDWYTNDHYTGATTFDYPAEWEAYIGHYCSFNPWESHFRVLIRKGKLFLVWFDGYTQLLVPVDGGKLRVGEETYLPERIHFDQVVDGEAWRAVLANCPYYRFFTP